MEYEVSLVCQTRQGAATQRMVLNDEGNLRDNMAFWLSEDWIDEINIKKVNRG